MTLELEKSRARIQAKAVRAAAHDRAAGVELIKHFPISEFRGAEIGGFWPIQTEIDPRPLLEALESMGHGLSLPCTPRPGNPLTFRRWTYGEDLKKGPHNTREPYGHNDEVFPDVVLVPMLAFTATGERLGYGGGFYDRTLEKLRLKKPVFACGVVYAAQEAAHLPTGEHDAPLDAILTEKEFRRF